jgi:UDP-N-acetylmuramate: L-alanyl-gamma-D-glutamyl-meso-diaminopimelate ligase
MIWLVLGASGTLMAGVIQLALEKGDQVMGIDDQFLPPIGPKLTLMGVTLIQGYPESLDFRPDGVIVGNAIMRGNPTMEWVMNQRIPYFSAPEWIGARLQSYDTIIAVCGTHGKTSTAAMLTWVLQRAGQNPGYLIAGVVNGFDKLASKGEGKLFVIEADEYDSAFFDKRPKCLHYRPTHLLINNLEYDHADIYPDLKSIQQQMRWMIRTVPNKGSVIIPKDDPNVDAVMNPCWSKILCFGQRESGLEAVVSEKGFRVCEKDHVFGEVVWNLKGDQWSHNALAALTLVRSLGVDLPLAIEYLSEYPGVERRRQFKTTIEGVEFWDDFAHHPTSIVKMLESFQPQGQLVAVFNPINFTQRNGLMQVELAQALGKADEVFMVKPTPFHQDHWATFINALTVKLNWVDEVGDLAKFIPTFAKGDVVLTLGASHYEALYQRMVNSKLC